MRRVALVCIGLVLLAAGIAKIAALSGPVDTLGWPREMIVAGSAVELLLGAWLLSGAAIRLAHLAAIGIFLLFALLSAYQVIRGVPSCGCLGKLYVHPAWMLTFDLVTLATLTGLWFFDRRERSPADTKNAAPTDRGVRSYLAYGSAFVSVAAVGLFVAGWTFAGSLGGAVAVAGGSELVVSPAVVDLGSGTVGETKQAAVRLVNASTSPVRIVGGKNSCGCMVTSELPVTIPARGSAAFPIEVTITSEGYREVFFTLYTDHDQARSVAGRVRMRGAAPLAVASDR
ncbi:MAG TPA: MauE/DoxX family redox-associated membrane protein [Pirellulaceae bacterium]|jgi:hypothetical protein|nr:MauE/DoxX family redox-associated membrane protein [Pirellulaceae bacterium]